MQPGLDGFYDNFDTYSLSHCDRKKYANMNLIILSTSAEVIKASRLGLSIRFMELP